MCKLDEPQFHDDEAARKYLESTLWPNGPVCPHCGSIDNAYVTGKSGLYRCAAKECRADFTVTVGTVFERSKVALHKWLLASFLICSSKKGMSAHQLHRTIGVTYKTAWFMAYRLREAMKTEADGPLGGNGGAVEVDETCWGGKANLGERRGGTAHKMKIVSLVERTGEKRSFHVANVTIKNVAPILRSQISKKARLMTDEAGIYTKVGKEFSEHGVVNHKSKEYSRGDVTTNTVESSFAILKHGLYGTFHNVSEQHLQRYADEFDFRWNYRQKLGYTDSDRAVVALKGIAGKRLMYRDSGYRQAAE